MQIFSVSNYPLHQSVSIQTSFVCFGRSAATSMRPSLPPAPLLSTPFIHGSRGFPRLPSMEPGPLSPRYPALLLSSWLKHLDLLGSAPAGAGLLLVLLNRGGEVWATCSVTGSRVIGVLICPHTLRPLAESFYGHWSILALWLKPHSLK